MACDINRLINSLHENGWRKTIGIMSL